MTPKQDNDLVKAILFYWIYALLLPATVLMFNLIRYLMNTQFQQWHVLLLWVFIIPITTIVIFLSKKTKKEVQNEQIHSNKS